LLTQVTASVIHLTNQRSGRSTILDDRLDLYYHTTTRRARKIVRDREFGGRDEVYVSDTPYGTHPSNEDDAAVHVRVAAELAELRVEWLNGEHLYRVPADRLSVIELA
jgi:hypothetical protein